LPLLTERAGDQYGLPLLTERPVAIVLPRRAPCDRLIVPPSGDIGPYPRVLGPGVPIVHRLLTIGPGVPIVHRLLTIGPGVPIVHRLFTIGPDIPVVHRLLAIGAQSLVDRCTRVAGSMVDP